jgi:repressor LexA
MGIGDKIRQRRKELGMSQEELALKMGYTSRSTINKIELGTNDITQSKVIQFADVLKTSPAFLMDWNNVDIPLPSPEPVREILIYGDLSCGTGLFVDDAVVGHVSIPLAMLPSKSGEYFAQYASGDSMVGAGISDGDLLIFEKTPQIDNGQIGCFCIDENIATCKKFSNNHGEIFLIPANDKYAPIPVKPENECFRILGREVLKVGK